MLYSIHCFIFSNYHHIDCMIWPFILQLKLRQLNFSIFLCFSFGRIRFTQPILSLLDMDLVDFNLRWFVTVSVHLNVFLKEIKPIYSERYDLIGVLLIGISSNHLLYLVFLITFGIYWWAKIFMTWNNKLDFFLVDYIAQKLPKVRFFFTLVFLSIEILKIFNLLPLLL